METRPLALWHTGPQRSEIMAAAPGAGPVAVRAVRSLISRGTERLVFEGRVPEGERARMRAPMQEGDFPFPVKYGYAAVGLVEDGPQSLRGRHVFALHPHQTRFRIPETAAIPVPVGVPPRRAALAANMETALNALWDAGAGPGDRIAVIGAGLIGCLIARLCALMPGTDVTMFDVLEQRRDVAPQLNVSFASSAPEAGAYDVTFHCSSSQAGLAAAMDSLGPEGRLVELSWYGDRPVAAPLGGAFHSRRLTLVSSQVGQVAPSRRPRWSHRRRLEKALALCADEALDCLLTEEVRFADLPARIPDIFAPGAPGIATLVRYD